jgi:hypothetical protein
LLARLAQEVKTREDIPTETSSEPLP